MAHCFGATVACSFNMTKDYMPTTKDDTTIFKDAAVQQVDPSSLAVPKLGGQYAAGGETAPEALDMCERGATQF